MKVVWATYRMALVMGYSGAEIKAMETITVHAPNGITWTAYKVSMSIMGER